MCFTLQTLADAECIAVNTQQAAGHSDLQVQCLCLIVANICFSWCCEEGNAKIEATTSTPGACADDHGFSSQSALLV